MASEQQNGHESEMDDSESSQILASLIVRARLLLSELELFRERLHSLRQEGNVELGHFRGTVKSELTMLERLEQKPNSEATHHIARSSNLPFLETVWANVKQTREVISLQKRIYVSSDVKLLSQRMRHVNLGNSKRRKEKGSKDVAVIVDAIVDGGKTWVKVSLITNTRIIFDLAKQGWDSGGSDSEGSEGGRFINDSDDDENYNSDDDRDVPLLKTAKELTKAAKCFRVRTKTPEVHIILPRVELGKTPEIDDIIKKCRATGAIISCGDDIRSTPDIESALVAMAPDPVESFPDVLNIDCTILLALVSEFSHAKVSKEPWFHAALKRQVEVEGNENLLPALLYPAMGNRKLVCTKEAIKRMREIVETIGTASEKTRTAIMMGDDRSKTQAELIADMQECSAHQVPLDWQLPLQMVEAVDKEHMSPIMVECCRQMSAINTSVFVYGWTNGYTTITSNRTVVKQLANDLEKFADLDDSVFPRIWLCPTARSLVGKEKRGASLAEKKKGEAWTPPDPLREEQ